MEDRQAILFEPDILLPQGYWETFRRKTSLPPEKMLMLAVLEDAISCIQKYARNPDSQVFREAVDWILEEKKDWPFSFENICGYLGLDAGYIREGLLTWTGKKVVKAPRGERRSVPKKAPSARAMAAARGNTAFRTQPAPETSHDPFSSLTPARYTFP